MPSTKSPKNFEFSPIKGVKSEKKKSIFQLALNKNNNQLDNFEHSRALTYVLIHFPRRIEYSNSRKVFKQNLEEKSFKWKFIKQMFVDQFKSKLFP